MWRTQRSAGIELCLTHEQAFIFQFCKGPGLTAGCVEQAPLAWGQDVPDSIAKASTSTFVYLRLPAAQDAAAAVTKSQGSACTASPPPHLPAHSNHGHKEHTSSTPAAHSPPARPQRGHEQAPAGQQLLTVATEALAELQHVMDRSRDRQAPAARTQVRPTEELPASTGLLQQWDEQALLNSYYKPIHRWLQGLFKSRNAPTKACGNTTTSPSAAPQQPLR